MKIERDERKFDFHGIGLAIKKARERKGMTQEQLGYIVDRNPRTIMYHENDGQHPSLNAFYQMVTMFGISVDEYFYPDMGADEAAKKRINIQLNSLNESELRLVEGIINTLSKAMWIRRRGYRAVPNQGQPHPGEIVLLLLLRKNRFLMRLAGFGVCDGRSVPRTDPQRQGRSSPTPARRRADSCQRSR